MKKISILLLMTFLCHAGKSTIKYQEISVSRIAQKKTGLCSLSTGILALENLYPCGNRPAFSLAYVQFLKWVHLLKVYKSLNPSKQKTFFFSEGGEDIDLYILIKNNNFELLLEEEGERENTPVIQLLSDNIDQNKLKKLIHSMKESALSEIVSAIYWEFGIKRDNKDLNLLKNKDDISEQINRFLTFDKVKVPQKYLECHKLYYYVGEYSAEEKLKYGDENFEIENPNIDALEVQLGSERVQRISNVGKALKMIEEEVLKGRIVPVGRSVKGMGHLLVVVGVGYIKDELTNIIIVDSGDVKKPRSAITVAKFLKEIDDISLSRYEYLD